MDSKSTEDSLGEASWLTETHSFPHLEVGPAVHALWDAHSPTIVFDRREPPYDPGSVVVGLEPDYAWELQQGRGQLKRLRPQGEASGAEAGEPMSLEDVVARVPVAAPAGFPTCVGGLLGYVGYEFIRLTLPNTRSRARDPFGFPESCLVRPTVFVILRAQSGGIEARLAALVNPAADEDVALATTRARRWIERIASELGRCVAGSPERGAAGTKAPATGAGNEPRASIGRERYAEKFQSARAMIDAGILTQVGIAQRFQVPFAHHPLDLWLLMIRNNPSPLGFALQFSDRAFVGTSPRVLIQLEPRQVVTRPIGGTRRRPVDRQLDAQTAEALLADQKEVGEHLMLFDAWVNDLRPIVEGGQVEVVERLRAEFFSHVIHIGSTLRGRPVAGLGPVEALKAVFPAPTVVGSPKAAAIAALDELEDEQRGIYGGCVGYIAAGGRMEMHIAIRAALVKDGAVHAQAGAGIVAESDVDYEYGEMESKAAAVLAAVRKLDEGRFE